MRLLRLAGITGAAFALSLVAGGALTPAQTATGAERVLPDLVQILPGKVGIAHRSSARGTRTLLTFDSSAENHGTGPLIIRGSRPDRTTTTMRADQLIRHTDDSLDRVRGVGALSFYRSRDHRHWHLARFMSYELRTRAGTSLRRDRKAGFCLGDRYDAKPEVQFGEPAGTVYESRCGLNRPDLTRLTQGISVGYGDRYEARLEGQYIDITGLASGRYVLIHRTNPDGRLLERTADNNVASMLVRIVRTGSRTSAKILGWCRGESCPAPTERRSFP